MCLCLKGLQGDTMEIKVGVLDYIVYIEAKCGGTGRLSEDRKQLNDIAKKPANPS